ncbi:MAG: gliding motility lipoprotein GldD [Lentimicrobiaceae bacterium]|nr:gliding motility lipoprotein GldD [Lentimicrobiaceae bacterium]
MKNKQSAVSSQQSVLKTIFLLLLVNCILLTVFVSCDDKTYQPKPKGYFRIDLPEKEYVSLDSMKYYSFEHPVYSKITPDYLSPEEKEWVNVEFPSFKGTIHISYKNVDNNIEKYLEDSYYMMTKHISRAMGIRDSVVANPERKVYGLVYFLEGEGVASPLQFYLTDSVNHFLRGSLYFNVKTNNDSLAPVIDFITDDIRHLIETVKWK